MGEIFTRGRDNLLDAMGEGLLGALVDFCRLRAYTRILERKVLRYQIFMHYVTALND